MPGFIRVTFAALILTVLAAPAAPVDGQILRKIKKKAQERVEQRTDQAIDGLVDAADRAVVCVVTDQECARKAREEGKEVTFTDEAGEEVPDPDPARALPGEGVWENYDFVPGERVLFFEDFSSEQVGNFPRRLEFGAGMAQVVESGGQSWLQLAANSTRVEIPLPEALPERFTMEFDVTMPAWSLRVIGGPDPAMTAFWSEASHDYVHIGAEDISLRRGGTGDILSKVEPSQVLGRMASEVANTPHRIRIHADDRYMKVYLDEKRVINVPVSGFFRGDRLLFLAKASEDGPVLITNLSVNAGGNPMYDALLADGRFVTRGILFDTGSDRLRPESTPTLKEIGTMLQQHTDLAVLIEGHTDAVGDDAGNLALSERRAAAVKSHLVQRFSIEPGRIEIAGMGEGVPVASNDTAEGRQQNRRVELVKR